jgi:dCTP deaminase
MGVLSDRQIKVLAQKGMITPFAEGQIRPGVISYGTTSYGYDVRLGYKFKVFKPYPCSIIDPKAFDQNMLEDVDLTPFTDHDWRNAGYDEEGNGPMQQRCNRCGVMNTNKHLHTWDAECFKKSNHILIPPHSFVLGESLEEFDIPRDLLVVNVGKSTYARCGVIVNVTPGEPEWKGRWTIEISNTTPLPVKVYCGEGIMQSLFLRSDEREQAILNSMEFVRNHFGNMNSIHEQIHYLVTLPQDCETSYADKKGKYQNQAGLTTPKVQKEGE